MVTVGSCRLLPWRPANWYLVSLIYLILTCLTTADLGERLGHMTPSDPLVATGDTLELNCTLSDSLEPGLNASSIYFDPPGQVVVKPEYVTVLDNRTISLLYPNATKSMNGHWFCRKRDEENNLNYGQQAVKVADRPVKPTITECRVYNWKNMTCWWEPKDQTLSTGIRTNQTLYWTLSKHYSYCPNPGDNSCSWHQYEGKDSLKIGIPYKMFVEAKNAVGSNQSDLNITHTDKKVEPAPVINLMVYNKNETSVQLKWRPPDGDKNIIYKVRYRSKDHTQWMEMNKTLEVTGNTYIEETVQGLSPYINYTFNVTCLPAVGGFWSKARVISARTNPSVPASAPVLPPGGFMVRPDQENTDKRKVTIFWKSIPKEYQNGPIDSYRIQYYGGSENGSKDDVPSRTNTYTLTLSKDDSYIVYVDARTGIGYNTTLELSPLLIQEESAMPSVSSRIVSEALNESTVFVNWTSIGDAVGYTVYWCTGVQQTLTCTTELQWITLDNNTSSYNVSLGEEKHVQVMFGVSVEVVGNQNRTKRTTSRNVISSGIEWSKCTYDINKPVIRPQDVKASEHQEAGTLSVEWTHPECSETAFADRYLIYYCPATECTGDPEADEEKAKRLVIESQLEEYTIENLNPSEYYVWMFSVSPRDEVSTATAPLKQIVSSSGLTKGKIAAICIAGIFVIFFIIFGLYQVIKTCRKKVEKEVTVTFKPPPEVSKEVMQRFDRNAESNEEYTSSYITVVDPEQQLSEQNSLIRQNNINRDRELPTQPNGHVSARARIYLGEGSAESKRLRNSRNNGEGLSSNDTVMTLLPQDSSGEPTEGTDNPQPLLIGREERDKEKKPGSSQAKVPYNHEASGGTSHQSGSTIPSYTKCGMPEDEEGTGSASTKASKEPIYEEVRNADAPPKINSPPQPPAANGAKAEERAAGALASASQEPARNQPDPGYAILNDAMPGTNPAFVAVTPSNNSVAPYCSMIPSLDYTNSPPGGAPLNDNGNNQLEDVKNSSNNLPLPGNNPMDYQQPGGYILPNGGVPAVAPSPGSIGEISKQAPSTNSHLAPAQPLPFTAGLPPNLMTKNNNNGYVTVNM